MKKLEEYIANTRQWIDMEHQEERRIMEFLLSLPLTQLEELGYAVTNLSLYITKQSNTGRMACSFYYTHNINKISLKKGDQVSIYFHDDSFNKKKSLAAGVIDKIKPGQIKIILDQDNDIDDTKNEYYTSYLIVIRDNDITYKRHLKILDKLKKHQDHDLIKILFDEYKFSKENDDYKLQGTSFQELNENQIEAVQKSLKAQHISLIHGPPGTGKTRTVCEFIKQSIWLQGKKILACAPSNVAVDNMVERLSLIGQNKIKFCRIGNPARTQESIRGSCLEALARKTEAYSTLQEIKKQLHDLGRRAQRATYAEKKAIKKQIFELDKEYYAIKKNCQKEVIFDSQVIFSTNTGADLGQFTGLTKQTQFDICVIDECAQALELSCWIPILKAKKIVLAGDHQQLPPTIKSKQAVQGLGRTLFQRIQEETNYQYSTLLQVQYRMNQKIMQWSSQQFYQGQLIAAKQVENHTTNDLSDFKQDDPIILVYIDTAGTDMYEEEQEEFEISIDLQKSKFNEGEVGLVQVIAEELINLGVQKDDIGVIAPYSAQVSKLREKLPDIEVSTVDGFQGREKECIIISMVRSNNKKEVGFLNESRRMNVAITRAKRFVCLIGNSDTVSSDIFLNNLINYFQEFGDLRSASQYLGDDRIKIKIADKKQQQIQQKQKKQDKKIKQQQQKQIVKDQHQNENDLQKQKQIDDYEEQIINFINANIEEIKFYNLNAFQRKILHDLSEKQRLNHQSIGLQDAALKDFIISKPSIEQYIDKEDKNRRDFQQEQESSEEETQVEEKNTNQVNPDKEIVQKDGQLEKQEVKENEKQHVVEIQKEQKNPQIQQQNNKKDKNKNKNKKDSKTKTQQQLQKEEDEFLDQIVLPDNNKCNYIKNKIQCTKPLNILSMKCQFCDKIFCTNHNLAEEHGCDERARQHARERFLNEARPDADRNRQLMAEKIKQAQQQRGPQKKK
ncbi:hypothetical protein pb186bvf_013766 [Paramecium bursaria]